MFSNTFKLLNWIKKTTKIKKKATKIEKTMIKFKKLKQKIIKQKINVLANDDIKQTFEKKKNLIVFVV